MNFAAMPALLDDSVWGVDDEETAAMTGQAPTFSHVTVMLREVIEAIAPRPGGVYLDVTLGGGGHSEALLEACEGSRVIGTDRDPSALAAASERLARFGDRFVACKSSFAELGEVLASQGLTRVDGLVADLGISSPQIDNPERGMSLRFEGPLDMRMDPTSGETAAELIQRLSWEELADVLFQLGEERRSRRIARCIKQADERNELHTTIDLRRAVIRAVGPNRVGGVDPATRSFQALRIAVNQELEQIKSLLAKAPSLVAEGGVISVISFHSLEDRLAKHAMQERLIWEPLTKKPLGPSEEEGTANPRSRSAKLRSARRLGEAVEEAPASAVWRRKRDR